MTNKPRHPTAAFTTVGCRLNQAETESIAGEFRERGWRVVDFSDEADLYFINTCTVTGRADRSSRQLIHRARRLNPEARIIAAGCFASRAVEELASAGEVDFVLGVSEKLHPFDFLNGSFARNSAVSVHVGEDAAVARAAVGARVSGRSRAFLKIQDGCDHQCAYCAVTLVRGPSRSVSREDVLAALRRIHTAGFEEVVFTGVDITAWGADLPGENGNFVDLVRMAAEEGIPRVRLSSVEPWAITPETIRELAAVDSWCEHLHLSLQSADSGVLKRMGRPMDPAVLEETLSELLRFRPESTIGADIIAGHPGEDEAAFRVTLDFVASAPLHYLHVFPFSPRPGTSAALMTDFPSPEVVFYRSSLLREMGKKKKRAHMADALGKTAEVLIEENGRRGFTSNYLRVRVTGRKLEPRRRHKVKLVSMDIQKDFINGEVEE